MARGQSRGSGNEGVQLLALAAIAFAVNIPLLALVMLLTGDTNPQRALILSLIGLLAGVAVLAALRWKRRRRTGPPF